jgi:hypothetical protein
MPKARTTRKPKKSKIKGEKPLPMFYDVKIHGGQ